MPDGTSGINVAGVVVADCVEKRALFNESVDEIKDNGGVFTSAMDELRAVDKGPESAVKASVLNPWAWFRSTEKTLNTGSASGSSSIPSTPPLRRQSRTEWRPIAGSLPRLVLRGGKTLLKTTAAIVVVIAIPLAGFAAYHHQEIETRVKAAKQGWDCAQTHLIRSRDGSGYYVQPILTEAECIDADGKSTRHVLSAPFRTNQELHAHVAKIATLEGRYSEAETLLGLDVIGAFGAAYRRVFQGGRGFSAPIQTAFEVQSGQRSFGGDYAGKLISIMASMWFTARYLDDPVARERFVSDGTPFVLDGREYAGAYGQIKLYGGVGDDLTLQMQCSAVASIKLQLRPGSASDPQRAAKALKMHVGTRFAACVNAHAIDQAQREEALEAGRKLCGDSDICQNPSPQMVVDKGIQQRMLMSRVRDLARTWGGDAVMLEGLASTVLDSTRLANLEGGQHLRGSFQTDVQRAVRKAGVATRDKIAVRTGIKPQVTSIVVEVTTPEAQILGVSSGLATGAVLPPPSFDVLGNRWVESDVLAVSGGSLNKAPTTLVAFGQGRSTICAKTQDPNANCKPIATVFAESHNAPFEQFNEQNEDEVRKLREAIGYRAPSAAGQGTSVTSRDFIHGSVERLPISQMIGFYTALLHGRFDGLVLIDGIKQGTSFDLDALGYDARARSQTLKAGEATFHGSGTLSGDLARMTAQGCSASGKTGTYNSGRDLFEKASIVLHQCGDRAFVTFALIKAPQGQPFVTGRVTSDDTHELHQAGLIAAVQNTKTQQ